MAGGGSSLDGGFRHTFEVPFRRADVWSQLTISRGFGVDGGVRIALDTGKDAGAPLHRMLDWHDQAHAPQQLRQGVFQQLVSAGNGRITCRLRSLKAGELVVWDVVSQLDTSLLLVGVVEEAAPRTSIALADWVDDTTHAVLGTRVTIAYEFVHIVPTARRPDASTLTWWETLVFNGPPAYQRRCAPASCLGQCLYNCLPVKPTISKQFERAARASVRERAGAAWWRDMGRRAEPIAAGEAALVARGLTRPEAPRIAVTKCARIIQRRWRAFWPSIAEARLEARRLSAPAPSDAAAPAPSGAYDYQMQQKTLFEDFFYRRSVDHSSPQPHRAGTAGAPAPAPAPDMASVGAEVPPSQRPVEPKTLPAPSLESILAREEEHAC